MAFRSTQPLTEMNTRNLPEGEGRPAGQRKSNLTTTCEPIVYKMWEPQRFTTLWDSMACYTVGFTFYHSKVFCTDEFK
jgi:hypothetical protein